MCRVHARTDLEDFRKIEPDPLLWEAAVPHEGEAARVHLEGAEPTDLRCLSHLALGLGSVLQNRWGPSSSSSNSARSRPCARPTGLHNNGRPRYWRGLACEDWGKCWPSFFTFVTGILNGMCGARCAAGRWKKKI